MLEHWLLALFRHSPGFPLLSKILGLPKFRLGARFLIEWCTWTMRSKLEPTKNVAKTLRRHHDLLMNWFEAKGRISAGIVEGFKNKAKLTTGKAYGFRTYRAAEIALYHSLADLPEPELTHKFC